MVTSAAFDHPSRGARQVCSLSPCLFVIAIELMEIDMRDSELTRGIPSTLGDYIISHFADDTLIATPNKKNNIYNFFDLISSLLLYQGCA